MNTQESPAESDRERRLNRFGVILIALVAVSITFRVVSGLHMQHTSLIFVGLPALLAWIVASSTPPATAAGSVMRATTLALLISWIFFGEAWICVLMAAPIFYLVGGIIALIRRRFGGGPGRVGVTALLLLPLSVEGVTPELSVNRSRVVLVGATVNASVEAVRAQLAATPRFDRELPLFFKLGFPTPGHTSGEGLKVGDTRSVVFAHSGHHDGALVMRVACSNPNVIRFERVSDDSYLTHWLSWSHATVSLIELPSGQTRVLWELHYERRLDPAWYFDPLERYGVTLAAKYLLATLTTPPTAQVR
jgi:hypothetical protein